MDLTDEQWAILEPLGQKPRTQDGRPLRRYRRHRKVERLDAWLQNHRCVLVRQDYTSRTTLASSTSPASSSCCGHL